jgi:aminopeptidase 2
MIGLPDFASGAMENWGLVTYRSKLLYVEKSTSNVILEQIAGTVCHELAHQWFGNLVTMEWWTDLWLNEGFATWAGTMALNKAFPDWNVWESFITDDFNRALDLDRLDNSHPIEVKVNKASEVGEIFDAISYSKGASVIRMLVNLLSEEVFRTGIVNYLKKYKYSNANTSVLWSELSKASGIDVTNMMTSWTGRAGFPLVKVEKNGDNTYTATQRRFGSESGTIWQFSIDAIKNIENPYENIIKHTLDKQSIQFSLKSNWFKLNTNCHNLCITQYPHSILAGLKSAVYNKILSPIDRSELLHNLFTLAEAGHESITTVLNFMVSYREEDSLIVIQNMLEKLTNVEIVWNNNKAVLKNIHRIELNLLKFVYEKLGWTAIQGEMHNDMILRRLVISKLGMLGYTPVLKKGREMFNNLMSDNLSVIPDLIKPVLTMCVKYGTTKDYNKVKHLYESSTVDEIKSDCMIAMGCVHRDDIADCMNYVFKSGKIRMQDMYSPVMCLSTGDNAMVVWRYITHHWNIITDILKGGNFLFSRIICAPIRHVSKESDINKIISFLLSKKHDIKDITRSINQELEGSINKIKWYERDNQQLENFIHKLHLKIIEK